jgi:hypothetical protein
VCRLGRRPSACDRARGPAEGGWARKSRSRRRRGRARRSSHNQCGCGVPNALAIGHSEASTIGVGAAGRLLRPAFRGHDDRGRFRDAGTGGVPAAAATSLAHARDPPARDPEAIGRGNGSRFRGDA